MTDRAIARLNLDEALGAEQVAHDELRALLRSAMDAQAPIEWDVFDRVTLRCRTAYEHLLSCYRQLEMQMVRDQ